MYRDSGEPEENIKKHQIYLHTQNVNANFNNEILAYVIDTNNKVDRQSNYKDIDNKDSAQFINEDQNAQIIEKD